MPKISEITYMMKLRKSLKNQPIELLKITLKEVREEIERRNKKK